MRPHLVHLLESFLPSVVAQLVAPTWFMLVGLAGVSTLLLVLRAARRGGDDVATVASAILWGYVAAVVAGVAVPFAADLVAQIAAGRFPHPRWAGMTSFWGYLGGLTTVALVVRGSRVSLSRLGDLAAAPLGLAVVLARLGCFIAGCDYGKVTSLPWAVRFPVDSPAWRDQVRAGLLPADRAASLPVHPAQLYEALLGLVMIAVAVAVARRPWAQRPGRVFLATAATYAIGRLGIEAVRGDVGRGFLGALSSGQVFCTAALIAIAAALVGARRRGATAALSAALAIAVPHPAHAQPVATPTASAPSDSRQLAAGLLVGVAAPMNRRAGQVPALAGPSASLGAVLGSLSLWLDLDSLANQDASHGTVLLSAGLAFPTSQTLTLGGRFGLGSTLVNFHEPVFRDVAGVTTRAELIADYALGDHWSLWVRPVSFDLLTAADLGGPILTWQFRIGLAYRTGAARRAPPPPPIPSPSPGPRPYRSPSPSPSEPAQPIAPYP